MENDIKLNNKKIGISNEMKLEAKIEAVLFFKGESLTIKKLADILAVSEEEVNDSLGELSKTLVDRRGITLMRKDDEVMLGTSPETDKIIRKILKEELQKELSRAGLETLATIIYHSPISRTRVDYIRGVNSSFILRNLMIRGLIERVPDSKDERSYLYKPSFELLQYLGINSVEEMPEFNKIKEEINYNLENTEKNEE